MEVLQQCQYRRGKWIKCVLLQLPSHLTAMMQRMLAYQCHRGYNSTLYRP